MIHKIKYLAQLLSQQIIILIVYLVMLVIPTMILKLQGDNVDLVWQTFQFTWIPVLLVIICRVYGNHMTIKKVQKRVPIRSWNPVLQVQQQVILSESQRFNDLESQNYFKTRQLIDYLMTWSHEMKLPIAALNLMAEQEAVVDSDQVVKQVALMKNQLEMLLSYERLNDFSHDLDFSWLTIADIIDETIREYSTFFIEKQLRPVIQVSSTRILSDQKWLLFIVKQLVYNAIKYSDPQSEIKINWSDNQLAITNHGLPIAANDLPRIFEPGFTGDNGHQQQAATGMGLYLVKQICQQLNITISVSSNPQVTTVALTFPKSALKV
ncbi:sensor histidine kinase [Convivina intestini]|uniref:sensor histidine kinase n=1 Tax=Convivina intestini TaxID=1505726 RepID=UPI00200D97C2|nr:sensor histidine kinase [Convivina intestini]CAH1853265.1 Adaptive-response sensory-kinase SasA [Convivina intestini]